MTKFTRTAYTGLSLRSVLREIVNDARLDDLPTMNSELYPRRHEENHPDRVRITITVEHVKSKPNLK
jgi:hypothetical protein